MHSFNQPSKTPGNVISMSSPNRPIERGEDEDEEPGGKWYNVEFHVKWKRWSYKHCSWDTLSTLSQLGGHKRVLNYCKRQDELEVVLIPETWTCCEIPSEILLQSKTLAV